MTASDTGRLSMTYKFQIRQIVRLVRTPPSDSRVKTGQDYEIIRLMPEDATGEISYRIRSGTTERAVREFEIKA
jgi:hypothetical protein